jgi:hypothetical protein
MAAAYQARDASFFREHDVRYSEAMANAIRNSPSVRVQLALENIDVADADHATATVQRTDEFEGGAPPGKQRLIYHLERRDGQWKIVRLSR